MEGASDAGSALRSAEVVLPCSAAIAASSLRRCPTAATPISFKSLAVSSGSTEPSTPLSRNAGSYWSRPSSRSQAATSVTSRSCPPGPRPGLPRAATAALPEPMRPSRPSGTFPGVGMSVCPEWRMRQGARDGPLDAQLTGLTVREGSLGRHARCKLGSQRQVSRRRCPPASGRPANRRGRTVDRPGGESGENNGMDLVDWTGQVPGFGEEPRSGERCPPSLRLSSIKVGARTAAKPAPFSARHRCGECCAKDRLEQR